MDWCGIEPGENKNTQEKRVALPSCPAQVPRIMLLCHIVFFSTDILSKFHMISVFAEEIYLVKS